ncbi:hypothetical protein ACJX0J_021238, partial [Zea mays]
RLGGCNKKKYLRGSLQNKKDDYLLYEILKHVAETSHKSNIQHVHSVNFVINTRMLLSCNIHIFASFVSGLRIQIYNPLYKKDINGWDEKYEQDMQTGGNIHHHATKKGGKERNKNIHQIAQQKVTHSEQKTGQIKPEWGEKYTSLQLGVQKSSAKRATIFLQLKCNKVKIVAPWIESEKIELILTKA